jgi:hypothetical protein
MQRRAIFYTPHPDSEMALSASVWLGRDVYGKKSSELVAIDGFQHYGDCSWSAPLFITVFTLQSSHCMIVAKEWHHCIVFPFFCGGCTSLLLSYFRHFSSLSLMLLLFTLTSLKEIRIILV